LERGDFGSLDPVGVAFAAGAAASWAVYILCSARVAHRVPGLGGLALAMAVAAVVVLPFGIVTAGPALITPRLIGLGAAVAFASSVVPYALELTALRTLPPATFSILMTLAPAAAAASGLVLLHQSLAPWQMVGIAAVIAASIGAVTTTRE
jgi:inner membrane transporter RhtA